MQLLNTTTNCKNWYFICLLVGIQVCWVVTLCWCAIGPWREDCLHLEESRSLLWLLDTEGRGTVGNIQQCRIISEKTWIVSLKAVSSVVCWPTWLLCLVHSQNFHVFIFAAVATPVPLHVFIPCGLHRNIQTVYYHSHASPVLRDGSTGRRLNSLFV